MTPKTDRFQTLAECKTMTQQPSHRSRFVGRRPGKPVSRWRRLTA